MKTINPIAAWHDEHVYFNQLLQLCGGSSMSSTAANDRITS
jgi:hypothetical protein